LQSCFSQISYAVDGSLRFTTYLAVKSMPSEGFFPAPQLGQPGLRHNTLTFR
jgi:hypothetical protein